MSVITDTTLELPSVMTKADVQEYVVEVVWPAFTQQREELRLINKWACGDNPSFLVPPRTSPEKNALLELGKTPWLGLVVDNFAQCLYVSGYRAEGAKNNVPGPWRSWQANNMRSRQIGIHRGAIKYGHSYGRVLPGMARDGKALANIRAFSPRRVFPLYEDPVADEFPRFTLELQQNGRTVRFYDNEVWFEFPIPTKSGKDNDSSQVTVSRHGVGDCPFVRYLNIDDLDGMVRGEVEKLITVASRIDKTLYDRLLAQHFNSVKIKYATGVDELSDDATDDDAARIKLTITNEDVLMHGNPEVKFGTLPETDLAGFIAAYESDLETLASCSQLPSNGLTGKLANLSADALASARANTTQKLYERQVMFGGSHAQLLRLAAHVEGDSVAAADFEAEITWQDMEVRSLAQAVDAWGKAATMLGVPKWATWTKLPNVTDDEARMWYEHLLDNDPEAQFLLYYGLKQSQDEQNNDPNATDDDDPGDNAVALSD